MNYTEQNELAYIDDVYRSDTSLESEELGLVFNGVPIFGFDGEDIIDKIVSLEDGFDITRNNWGYLNIEYWANITGYTVDQIIELA